MKRTLIFIYGVFSYLLFLATVLYTMAFLNNTIVPTGIDKGDDGSLAEALAVNLVLIGLFGLVHSVMARQRFKAWWTGIIPETAERSTFILQANLLMLLILWQWRPIPVVIWSVEAGFGRFLIQGLHWLGWVIVIVSTFLINHFHFFGLQQVFANLVGKAIAPPQFMTPFLYKVVRHPMQLGLLIAFWVTADMTVGHFLFAAAMTIYIVIGLYFEERDLVKQFGEAYIRYRQTTPKLFPGKPANIKGNFASDNRIK